MEQIIERAQTNAQYGPARIEEYSLDTLRLVEKKISQESRESEEIDLLIKDGKRNFEDRRNMELGKEISWLANTTKIERKKAPEKKTKKKSNPEPEKLEVITEEGEENEFGGQG